MFLPCPFRNLGSHTPLDCNSTSRFTRNVPGKRLKRTVKQLADGRVELGTFLLVGD